eukprot:6818539-Prymnesium_polylepis.1
MPRFRGSRRTIDPSAARRNVSLTAANQAAGASLQLALQIRETARSGSGSCSAAALSKARRASALAAAASATSVTSTSCGRRAAREARRAEAIQAENVLPRSTNIRTDVVGSTYGKRYVVVSATMA